MKTATIYARVSTKDQHPENQVKQLKEFARVRGFKVVKVYQEKRPGNKNDRPLFQQLLNDVRKRKTDIVLVWKLDRLARSTTELLNRLKEFKSLGVELLSYTENIDTTTPAGKALFSMVAVFAEFENDIRRERIIAGMQRASEKGSKIGRPALPDPLLKEIEDLKNQGITGAEIMRKTGIARNTLRKYTR